MTNSAAPVRVGELLGGKYRVERILGQGAMGVVVAAMHVDLQEMRAIKFMLPGTFAEADYVERFLREARAAARLKSQHAAKVHDVGRFESGAPYIVMEYLEGEDLKHYLEKRGTLPVMEAVAYTMQACEALAEAHSAGIVHRDLKPANIYLTTGPHGTPCVKILDFGIAKIQSGSAGAMEMTKTSELLGTPLYMSPEQMRSTRNVDARTDVWALGTLLYKMLTGKTPFTGTTVTEICSAVIADPVDPPTQLRSDIPKGLEAIILRCLEKQAAQRPANAAELGQLLGQFVREHAANATASQHRQAPAPIAPQPAAAPIATVGSTHPSITGASVSLPSAPAATASGVHQASSPDLSAAPPRTPTGQPKTVMLDSGAAATAATAAAAAASGVAPAAAAQTTPPGLSTARASTWTQSTQAAEPARSSSKLPILALAAALLLGGAGAAVFFLKSGSSAAPAVDSTSQTSTAAAPPSPSPTIAPSAEAPAPTAEPSISASASATAPVASVQPSAKTAATVKPTTSPTTKSTTAPTTTKKKDAFGNDRK
ncbi:MAG: serine/threonine protein kinase [Polyangiaceae bacterium]|nr:serine/threonine protein kinase [Polyangiaceae bacterium]